MVYRERNATGSQAGTEGRMCLAASGWVAWTLRAWIFSCPWRLNSPQLPAGNPVIKKCVLFLLRVVA